eukprot:2174290-Pyramimonas_sp.AAC.1
MYAGPWLAKKIAKAMPAFACALARRTALGKNWNRAMQKISDGCAVVIGMHCKLNPRCTFSNMRGKCCCSFW